MNIRTRDKSKTKATTRPGKTQDGRDMRDLNKIGDRIRWARNTLGLTQYRVATDTGIPRSSYHGRENGTRAIYPEEYLVIAKYLNGKWEAKFSLGVFPEYGGLKIDEIKVAWLLFGRSE